MSTAMEFVLIVLGVTALLLWLTVGEDDLPAMCGCEQSCSWRRMFRHKVRRHKVSADDEPAWSFGLRLGYWPCLKAPFIEGAFLFWKVQVWHGYADREMFARGDA